MAPRRQRSPRLLTPDGCGALHEVSLMKGDDSRKPKTASRDGILRILVIASPFPSVADTTRGVFIKEQLKAMADVPGVELRIISPVPWFPPIRRFSRWYRFSQYPRSDCFEGLTVYHPRYPLPPKVGGYVHPALMYGAARRVADALRRQGFSFQIIDSHFVYPCGVVAHKLAKRYRLPFSVTGRGEDMLRFPSLPIKRSAIRRTLAAADQCVALSSEIAEVMKRNGASPGRVHVVPNGVDTELFRLLPQADCRRKLGLPTDIPIILSVGDLLELKGFHILVEAMPTILRTLPEAMLIIVGGPGRHGRDYSLEIQRRIEAHQLGQKVRLVGPVAHHNLPYWYNAADLFALMSSREGSPNVLIEALACGTPCIGTPVGGIVDELASPLVGGLTRNRTPAAAAELALKILSEPRSRSDIAASMAHRSRRSVAARLVKRLTELVQAPSLPLRSTVLS